MKALTPTELLRAWETAAAAPPALRGAALIAAAEGVSQAKTGELPLGELARRLLALRTAQFGPDISALTDCPTCAQPVELHFRTRDLEIPPMQPEPVTAWSGGRRFQLRPPNSRDVHDASRADTAAARECHLFRRCLIEARDTEGQPLEPAACDDDDGRAAAASALAGADPGADLELALRCPHCRHEWLAPFDPAAFLMTEITARARQLLRDVHELAAAYGWSEADILALSPTRRAAYLELVRG
jgi:hypothetical protein